MFCLLILSIGCKLWWVINIHEQEGYQIGGKLQSNFCPMLLPWSSMLSLLSICSNCLVQHMLSPLYARRIAMSVLYASDVRTRAQASPLLYRALLLWKHKGTRNTFLLHRYTVRRQHLRCQKWCRILIEHVPFVRRRCVHSDEWCHVAPMQSLPCPGFIRTTRQYDATQGGTRQASPSRPCEVLQVFFFPFPLISLECSVTNSKKFSGYNLQGKCYY